MWINKNKDSGLCPHGWVCNCEDCDEEVIESIARLAAMIELMNAGITRHRDDAEFQRDLQDGWKAKYESARDETTALKAEVDRLKGCLKDAEIVAADAIYYNEKYIQEGDQVSIERDRAKSRARAWKRCAKRWKADYWLKRR